MRTRGLGFALVELLVLIVILVALVALVIVVSTQVESIPHLETECMSNVRGLVSLLESVPRDARPELDGANLILYLVKQEDLNREALLQVLFCPGDEKESLKQAGGPEAYERLDLSVRSNGHLTSYAGRRMRDPACTVRRASGKAVVLIADDSEDHHRGTGMVVGLSGGVTKWRDKVEDYRLRPSTKLVVGPESVVEELRCLSAD